MAAGEGRRLRPLTKDVAEAAAPDRRPAGRRDAAPRARRRGSHPRDRRDGTPWRSRSRSWSATAAATASRPCTVRQPRPDGSADAVRVAFESGAAAPAIVVAADTVFQRGDIALFKRRLPHREQRAPWRCAAIPRPARDALRSRSRRGASRGFPTTIRARGSRPPRSGAWAAGSRELRGLPGPPYELVEAYRARSTAVRSSWRWRSARRAI